MPIKGPQADRWSMPNCLDVRGFTRRVLFGQALIGQHLLGQVPAASVPAPAVTTPVPGAASPQTPVVPPVPEDPLRRLRTGHPRLLLLDSELDHIRQAVRENPVARKLQADLEKECDRLLSVPPVEYKITGGRLQTQTRRAIDRITTLSLLFRLTGRDAWLRRAVMEMNAASNFRDWNPSRFVDTAEMTHAFAIGYDWLYNSLSDDERGWIREALLAKGIDQALPFYRQRSWWTRDRFHWNVVCNSAIGMAALAVADEAREKSVEVLYAMSESTPYGLNSFGSDGSWPEGPFYGTYATRYACLLLASLDTALGGDMVPAGMRGIEKSGRLRAFTLGPANRLFNYADTPEEPMSAPEMFLLARRFNIPALAWSETRLLDKMRADPLHLAWFERESRGPQNSNWPLDAVFSTAGLATFRSSWDEPTALFLAVKGGDNKLPHGHLDLGSFVLDAGGVRWASDLGPDEYTVTNLPRNSFFRVKTEAHNTIVVEGENQEPRGEARMGRLETLPDLSFVQVELAKTSPRLRRWTRRIGVAQRQAVVMEDSIRSDQPVDAIWGMMTDAEVVTNGSTATLRKNGWTLAAEIRSPRHAVFDVTSVRIAAPQAQNRGFQRLVVRLLEKVTEIDLNITLTPYRDGQARPKITVQFPA